MVVVKNWVICHEVGDIALTICVVVQRPKSFLVLIEGDANLLSAHTTHTFTHDQSIWHENFT